jgi:hypothetical protein
MFGVARNDREKGKQRKEIPTKQNHSPTGTRTPVVRVKAEYPDQLDYRGLRYQLCSISNLYMLRNVSKGRRVPMVKKCRHRSCSTRSVGEAFNSREKTQALAIKAVEKRAAAALAKAAAKAAEKAAVAEEKAKKTAAAAEERAAEKAATAEEKAKRRRRRERLQRRRERRDVFRQILHKDI